MKYGVNRKVLLITAGIVWMAAGANILRIGIVTWLTDSQYWLGEGGGGAGGFFFQDRRGYGCISSVLFAGLQETLLQAHQTYRTKKEREELPFFFLRCKRLDCNGLYDNVRHYDTLVPFIAGRVYFGILYRAFACTHVHRGIVYTLLVGKQKKQSAYSAARRMKVVAPMVTIAPSSIRTRSLSPRISLLRKVPVRLGASRSV